MAEGSEAGLVALGPWLEGMLEPHRSEIEARGLLLRLDLDAGPWVREDAAVSAAFRELLRLILATVPDDCEVFVGASPSTASVSPLGAGQWSVRWQVTGETVTPGSGGRPIPLHPRPGHAERHVRSSLGRRVISAFAKTDWAFSLETLNSGAELRATAKLHRAKKV